MKKKWIYMLLFFATLIMTGAVFSVKYGFSEESDPIVTQSYVEMRLDQVKEYFEGKISTLTTNVDTLRNDVSAIQPGSSGASVFVPVTVNAGKSIIGGAGSEMIIRVGYCKAIATSEGGIVDATGGVDIQNGKEVPKQHLLIIPRNDGRGLYVADSNDAIVMVKGSYTIQ